MVVCILPIGRKPFKNLDASEIASSAVRLTPPDKTVQIVETKELVSYLKNIVIYHEDNSYTEYAGQGVTFILEMVDGTQKEIMVYNPFLVIDGVGYRTKYEPCEVLNRYANRLLNAQDAVIILEEPPSLSVISDKTSCYALLGSYSWQRKNNDGSLEYMEADSAHPLDCRDLLVQLDTAETTAILQFAEKPDTILDVRCWSDEYWDDPTANSEAVTVNGRTIELKPGGYIYEVKAQWSTESGYGGIAYYTFYIKTQY